MVYGFRTGEGVIVKGTINNNGYRVYSLGGAKGTFRYTAHSLVAKCFIPSKDPTKNQVCHIDGNPLNNVLSNLRWGSAKDNADDRSLHGRQGTGELSGNYKLQQCEVDTIRILSKRGVGTVLLSKVFNTHRTTITRIKQNETWNHITKEVLT